MSLPPEGRDLLPSSTKSTPARSRRTLALNRALDRRWAIHHRRLIAKPRRRVNGILLPAPIRPAVGEDRPRREVSHSTRIALPAAPASAPTYFMQDAVEERTVHARVDVGYFDIDTRLVSPAKFMPRLKVTERGGRGISAAGSRGELTPL